MHKQKLVLGFLILFVCFFTNAVAQITISPSTGCMPNGISNALFTYTGPGSITNVSWNFGDGSPPSTQNPTQHSYANVGTFNVTLTGMVNGNPVSYSSTVAVNPQPSGSISGISIPPSHCAPMSVSFTGNGAGSNIVYNWDYGDGNVGVSSNPTSTYIYQSPGSFGPILTITNTLTACFLNVPATTPVIVSNPPFLVINTTNGLSSCANSFTTAFTGTNSVSGSPISGALTYNWNFGSFGSSTSPSSAPIVFTPQGVYPVVLTITDNNNCSTSNTVNVSLVMPTVTAVVPPYVCVNSQLPPLPTIPPGVPSQANPNFQVTVQSSEPATTWNMGDGNPPFNFPIPIPPSQIPPVLTPSVPYTSGIYNYSIPGLKTVTITATAGPCIATITRTIMVEEITPLFSGPSPTTSCSSPYTLNYINLSTINTPNQMNYEWGLNHWDALTQHVYTSNATNPTFNVTQGSLSQYATFDPYVLTATLVVRSFPTGCKVIHNSSFDMLQRPTAIFETDKGEGCAPLSVTFTNTSTTNTLTYPITSYTWNFGTTPPSTFIGAGPNIPPQVFNYTSPGVYYPTLTIATAGGCSHTSYQHTITVADPPAFTFTIPPSPICANTQVTVNLLPVVPNTIQHWHIESDQGYFSGCVADPNPEWKFTHVGTHDFTITAYDHSCKSTSVIPAAVSVSGPIGKMRYKTNCSNRLNVDFSYHLNDVQNATLNFGDGSPILPITGVVNGVVTANVSHTYVPGNYTATLTSVNNNCPQDYTHTVSITVTDLQANFFILPGDTVVCGKGANSFVQVNSSLSVNVYTVSNTGYTWYIDDLAPFQSSNTAYTFTDHDEAVGIHSITLVVRDINGCKDSHTETFRVSAPVPTFTFNSNPICLSAMPAQMINTTSQTPDPVSNYIWRMGDAPYNFPPINTFIFGTTPNHSPTFNFPMGFAQVRTFTVALIATNSIGCVDSVKHMITVNNPLVNAQGPLYSCVPSSAKLFSVTAAPSHVTYTLDYGDGTPPLVTNNFNQAMLYTTPHVFGTQGTYTPIITVVDNGGCTRTETLWPIVVQNVPVPTFTFVNNFNDKLGPEFCGALQLSVTATGADSSISHIFSWNFGNGFQPPPGQNIGSVCTVTVFGVYTVSLNLSTIPSQCTAKSSQQYSYWDPTINFAFVPDSMKRTYCLGEPITMSVTSMGGGADNFKWDFGDGVVRNAIYPQTPPIPFLLNASYTNTFFPETVGNELTIQVTGYKGSCEEPKRKTVKIIRVLGNFELNSDTALVAYQHCLGIGDIFRNRSTTNAGSALTYTWTYGDGSPPVYVTDANHIYSQPGTYSITMVALEPLNGCTAKKVKSMTIWPLPSATLSTPFSSCPSTSFEITGSGTPGTTGLLTGTVIPANGLGPLVFSPNNTFTLNTTANETTTYSLYVTDQNGCRGAMANSSISVQEPAPIIHWDTTVVIGQPSPLNAYVGPDYTYTWTPLVDHLNCDTCLLYNPISTTTANITYTVLVEDILHCSIVPSTYRVIIRPVVSLDVPTAFTPNGDGVNDMIVPGGWGIRKLIYFKIFNRWGQLVFESNDLNVGWDGVFNGVPQNMETYVYQVSVETYLDLEPTLYKTGTFKLLR